MEAVFSLIWKMAQGASFVVWCVLLARLLLKKAPKVWSYALWVLVLLRLVCPVFPQTQVSVVPEDSTAVVEFDTVIHSDILVSEEDSGDVSDAITATVTSYSLYDMVYILWPFGIMVMAVYGVASLIHLKRKLRFAVPAEDNIFEVDHIDTPFVVGIFRPKIYLPSDLGQEKRGYIIEHEQHHIRRFDPLVKLLAYMVLCVYWFSPMIWVAFLFMCRDMEMSCDEAVMKKLGGDIRADYAESLLQLSAGKRFVAPMPLAFGEGDPKKRIKNILNWKKPTFWAVAACIVLLAVACVCLLTNPVMVSGDGSGQQIYTVGEYLAQNGFISYIPEDRSPYRQISLNNGALTVSNKFYQIVYKGAYGKATVQDDYDLSDSGDNYSTIGCLNREELLQFLSQRGYIDKEKLMEQYRGETIEVRRYYDADEPNEPQYTLFFFDGELRWFAEGDAMRIYPVERLTDSGAFDPAASPWQWSSNVTTWDVTACSVTWDSHGNAENVSRSLNAKEIGELVTVLNCAPRKDVVNQSPDGAYSENDLYVLIRCGGREYGLCYENQTVRIILDSESAALYIGNDWFIDNEALYDWMENMIAKLKAET